MDGPVEQEAIASAMRLVLKERGEAPTSCMYNQYQYLLIITTPAHAPSSTRGWPYRQSCEVGEGDVTRLGNCDAVYDAVSFFSTP